MSLSIILLNIVEYELRAPPLLDNLTFYSSESPPSLGFSMSLPKLNIPSLV